MKHLFLINSHTSFLSAVGTIDYLGLQSEDVVFFTVRNYKNTMFELAWKTVDISDIFSKYTTHEIWHERKKRNDYLKLIDHLIEGNVSENFKLYAFHYAHPGSQMIYTHPLCVEGAYIQEGGVPFKKAYVTNPKLFERFVAWTVNKLYLKTRRCHYPLSWYYPGFLNKQQEVHSFAISNNFFKYLPSTNHIIKWPQKRTDVKIKDDSMVFIFDGFVRNTFCEKDFYLKCCKRLILEESHNFNYVRFHPAQMEDEKSEIISFFTKHHLSVEVMDPTIPFEWILTSCNMHLYVCGFGSSLLYFAKDMGHNVVCRDEWLIKSKLYRKYKEKCGFIWFKDSYE